MLPIWNLEDCGLEVSIDQLRRREGLAGEPVLASSGSRMWTRVSAEKTPKVSPELFIERVSQQSEWSPRECVEKIQLLRKFKRSEESLASLEKEMTVANMTDDACLKYLRQYINSLKVMKESGKQLSEMRQSLGVKKKIALRLKPHQELISFMESKYWRRCEKIALRELGYVLGIEGREGLESYLDHLEERHRPLVDKMWTLLESADGEALVRERLMDYWQAYSPGGRNLLSAQEGRLLMEQLVGRIHKRTWKISSWKKVLDALEQKVIQGKKG